MLLYEHPLSSYVQKVKIALREKGLEFDRKLPEGFGTVNPGAEFAGSSVRLQVPSLIDGEAQVFDSTIIMEYLEDKYPEPALLPADPAARAEARMIEDLCDTVYEAINWGLGEVRFFRRADGARAEEMRANAARQTAELLDWLTEKLGDRTWFNGDTFGWADIAVAPYVNRSFFYDIGTPEGAPLTLWRERLIERPSVKQTFAEFEEAAKGMMGAHERLADPNFRREYRDFRLEWMVKSGGLDIVLEGMKKNNIRFSWPE